MKQLAAIVVLAGIVLLPCCSLCCTGESGDESIRILTWNVQNLFDGTADGGEYIQYDPQRSAWNQSLYHKRLEKTGEILQAAEADIILLQEIEHRGILEDLCTWYLDDMGEARFAAVSDSSSPIAVGVISRFPIIELTSHMAVLGNGKQQRPMLKAVVSAGDAAITCFVSHWKSRSGGLKETVSQRRASSQLLQRLIVDEQNRHPSRLVTAAGDFNTSLADAPEGLALSEQALLPYGESGVGEVLTLTGRRRELPAGVLYDFWEDSSFKPEKPGSYSYQGSWLQLDHIAGGRNLFDGEGYDLEGAGVFAPDMVLSEDGTPYSWSRYRCDGVSDHLPLYMDLEPAGSR